MEKFWCKLLSEKQKKGTGLTLPFLIGAQEVLNSEKKLNIKELIDEMVNADIPVIIKHCHQTKEYIFTLNKELGLGYHKYEMDFGNLKIIADNNFLTSINEYEHIIDTLESCYLKTIQKKEFSRFINFEKEGWRKFDKDDLDFIKSAV